MSNSSLQKIFQPKSVAVIGANDRAGSVGYTLMKNLTESGYQGLAEFGYRGLTEAGYQGTVYPVNVVGDEVCGRKVYRSVAELPERVDLAIIATPARTVPSLVAQCAEAGVPGLIIISAGFKEVGAEGQALWNQMVEIAAQSDLRIVGPNCLGVINPHINLNATFSDKMPSPGNVAFISQSGAIITTTLDWAIYKNIGFSYFVSVGSMIDVDFGDLLDYFGEEANTESILMYIEGVTNARSFMSAARHFSRTKPIIVVKSGLFSESAKAVASHTGALTGESMVYDAAFKRAGIIRVDEIEDLFNCAEVLSMQQPLPRRPNLAIITNAGGPGIITADALLARGGQLAALQDATVETLNKSLPPFWSKANPVDVLGDAKTDRYAAAVEACYDDDHVEGLLLIYSPQGVANPAEIARTVAGICQRKGRSKPLLTSFMGYGEVEEANRIFHDNGIPAYATPEQAIKSYMWMYQYKRNLELLYEIPEELPVESIPSKRPITVILQKAARSNRAILTELEAKNLLAAYSIPVVETRVAKTEEEAGRIAAQLGYPVVLKILSPQITHKTDAGGVILDINTEAELKAAYNTILQNAAGYNPDAEIQGVTVQPMVKKQGYEVILGAKTDPLFGPVILFGMGGIGVELFRDVAIGLPPLNQTLARRIIEDTKVYTLLKGYRNNPPANLKLLEEIMVRFSQMLVDFPQIQEFDINPMIVDADDAVALDARVVIDPKRVFTPFKRHAHLVIVPYPKRYEQLWNLHDGQTLLLRSIKPEDEPLWLEMLRTSSPESIRQRFPRSENPRDLSGRSCNIDYDREIAIIAEFTEGGQRRMVGIGQVFINPNAKTGEVALFVADPWQNLGLGSKLVDYLIEISKEKNLETLTGTISPQNHIALDLMERMGFTVELADQESVQVILDLKDEVMLS